MFVSLLIVLIILFTFKSEATTTCLPATLVFALHSHQTEILRTHVEHASDAHFRNTFAHHLTKEQVDLVVAPSTDRITRVMSLFPDQSEYEQNVHHVSICQPLSVWENILGPNLNAMPVEWQGEIVHIMGLSTQHEPLLSRSKKTRSTKSFAKTETGNFYYSTPPQVLASYYGITNMVGAKIALVEYDDEYGYPISINPNDAPGYVNLTTRTSITSPVQPQPITISGPNNPNNVRSVEASLDVDAVLGLAPEARIYYLQSSTESFYGSLFTIYNLGINVVEIVSISYGTIENYGNFCGTECVTDPTLNNLNYLARFDSLLLMLASVGITVLTSSGDLGSNAAGSCNGGTSNTGMLDVSFPCTSDLVTCVGATSINFQHYTTGTLNPNAQYCNLTPTNNQGYHFDNEFVNFGGFACYYTNPSDVLTEQSVSIATDGYTSGGGFSTYYKRPSYQNYLVDNYLHSYSHTDVNFPVDQVNFNSSNRAAIDISFYGSTVYLVNNNSYLTLAGGTSLSSPLLTSLVAMFNNISRVYNHNQTIGFLNPLLYYMAEMDYNDLFYDVTIGTNNCNYEVNRCTATNGVCLGWDSTQGYDLTSGLGTPKAQAMVAWLINYFQATPNVSSLSSIQTSTPSSSHSSSSSSSTGPASKSNGTLSSLMIILIVSIIVIILIVIVMGLYFYVSATRPVSRRIRSSSRRRRGLQ